MLGVLLPALRKAGNVTLTTVVASTGISAGHAREKFGFTTASTDPLAAFSDGEANAIFVATRHDSHSKLTAQALAAGKHVFCEKPLAIDARGLREVITAAQAASGILTVDSTVASPHYLSRRRRRSNPASGPLVMLYRVNAGAIPSSWIQREEGGGRIVGGVPLRRCALLSGRQRSSGSTRDRGPQVAVRFPSFCASVMARPAPIVYSSLGDPSISKEYIEVFANGQVVQIDDFRRIVVTANGKSRVSKSTRIKAKTASSRPSLPRRVGNAKHRSRSRISLP